MANLSRWGEVGKVVPGEIIFRVLKEKWELGEEGRKGLAGIATGTEARRAFAPGNHTGFRTTGVRINVSCGSGPRDGQRGLPTWSGVWHITLMQG